MTTVADVIRQHHAEIVSLWREQAARAASARDLASPALMSLMPLYLSTLAEQPDSPAAQTKLIERHLAARIRHGYDLAEILEEFALLERTVARFWGALPAGEQPERADLERFHANLQFAASAAIRSFLEHMQFDEQREKRYVRVLQELADAALRDESQSVEDHLQQVAELVMEAVGAPSAAILFHRADGHEPVASVASGVARDELARRMRELDAQSFPVAMAASDAPAANVEAGTIDLDPGDQLRRSGLRALFGLRLPFRHELVGLIVVGIEESRAFSASEARRLEALGEKLVLHVENARLYAGLRERIAELDRERGLRERFVAVLAHDLRGPLTTAKLTAQRLARAPETPDQRRGVALRLERALDRMERMIRDLLDVARVRAGQRLPLRLDACDLGGLAEQVVEEARLAHGDERVALHAEGQVRGVWSEEDLRRALWNLVTNGLKYGASDRPVVVRVERTSSGARVSVHNEGNPIPPDRQARIFDAFERQPGARERTGWGLGLTLVRACAEAHGGTVALSSAPGTGTTFTLDLPLDSRPFQAT